MAGGITRGPLATPWGACSSRSHGPLAAARSTKQRANAPGTSSPMSPECGAVRPSPLRDFKPRQGWQPTWGKTRDAGLQRSRQPGPEGATPSPLHLCATGARARKYPRPRHRRCPRSATALSGFSTVAFQPACIYKVLAPACWSLRRLSPRGRKSDPGARHDRSARAE